MIAIKKYLPYILLAGGVLIGIFIAPRNDKDLKRQFEKTIKTHEAEITRLKQDRKRLDKDRATILAKAYQDSVKLSNDLRASNARIIKYQKHINAINISLASGSELDSIIAGLYPD